MRVSRSGRDGKLGYPWGWIAVLAFCCVPFVLLGLLLIVAEPGALLGWIFLAIFGSMVPLTVVKIVDAWPRREAGSGPAKRRGSATLVVRGSRRKYASYFILGVGYFAAGVLIAIYPQPDPNIPAWPGWVLMAFGGLSGPAFLRLFVRREPTIVLSERGIRHSAWGFEVPWEDVAGVHTWEVRDPRSGIRTDTILFLDLRDHERYAERLPRWTRILGYINRSLGYTAFHVQDSRIDARIEDVREEILRRISPAKPDEERW